MFYMNLFLFLCKNTVSVCPTDVYLHTQHKSEIWPQEMRSGLKEPLFVSHLTDVDRWQSLTRGVSAGGDLRDHGGLWRCDT